MTTKSFTLLDLSEKITEWKNCNEKIVFTNGVFDILHLGHIDYLEKAKKLGTKLVVAINSDASVRLLNKGIARPLQDEYSRACIINALKFVDAVIIFEEPTPINLIKSIAPNILIKGGDYVVEDIIGFTEVKFTGGTVLTIPFLKGYSTSNIEQKILNSKV